VVTLPFASRVVVVVLMMRLPSRTIVDVCRSSVRHVYEAWQCTCVRRDMTHVYEAWQCTCVRRDMTHVYEAWQCTCVRRDMTHVYDAWHASTLRRCHVTHTYQRNRQLSFDNALAVADDCRCLPL